MEHHVTNGENKNINTDEMFNKYWYLIAELFYHIDYCWYLHQVFPYSSYSQSLA